MGEGETREGGVTIVELKIKELGSHTALARVYHELLLSLFWQKDRSNSHLAFRELYLSHKTRKETIKKMHLL